MDAQQQLELFQGVVQGMALEVREQFTRMNQQIATTTRETGRMAQAFGDASTNQLRGFLGQFGMMGDALGDMIPALSGTSAAMMAFAGGTVAAGAALAQTAFHTMDYTGKVDDLAQMTNLTTETIQSLRLAATLSGQTFEDTAQTAVIFQKKMEEAKNGNQQLAATFKQLGVDLNGSVDAAFRRTLERFSAIEDGSAKTAAGLELFGKGASKLFGVMNQVNGSFSALEQRARDLGIVLDKEAIAKANELADRWDILKLKMDGLVLDVGMGVITWFQDLATDIEKAADAVTKLIGNIDKLPGQPLTKLREAMGNLKTGPLQPGTTFFDWQKGGGQMEAATAEAQGALRGMSRAGMLANPLIQLESNKPTTGKAAAEKAISLPSGDAVKRTYESFRQAMIAEERATQAQREKLRIDAIQGEEAKLRDQLIRQDEAIAKARADAAAGARTSRAGVLDQVVANLEAEKALTMRAIDEIETARVQAIMRFVEAANAQTADRLANELNAEEEYLDQWAQAYEDALLRIDEQVRASAQRRRQDLEEDPSSPLNIFGPEGQKAADRGAGMFGQMGASIKGALQDMTAEIPKVSEMMNGMFQGIAMGLQNMIQGFILTGKLGGQAFKAMAAQIISAVAAEAAVKAIFNLAEGFAASAMGMPQKAAGHFTAAKIYGIVAGMAATAAIGLSAIGPGGGAGGQFLAQDRGTGGGTMIREQGGRRSNEPQVIIIRAETEPGVVVNKVVQDYRSNGEMRGMLRRDLLGEF